MEYEVGCHPATLEPRDVQSESVISTASPGVIEPQRPVTSALSRATPRPTPCVPAISKDRPLGTHISPPYAAEDLRPVTHTQLQQDGTILLLSLGDERTCNDNAVRVPPGATRRRRHRRERQGPRPYRTETYPCQRRD